MVDQYGNPMQQQQPMMMAPAPVMMMQAPQPQTVIIQQAAPEKKEDHHPVQTNAKHAYKVTCPVCKKVDFTNTEKSCGATFWIVFAIVLFLFWPGLICMPCGDCLKDTEHRCGKCNSVVNTVNACS